MEKEEATCCDYCKKVLYRARPDKKIKITLGGKEVEMVRMEHVESIVHVLKGGEVICDDCYIDF